MKNTPLYIRKSIYELSDQEIQNLRNAFDALYTLKLPHQNTMAYQYHAGILQSDGHYQRNDLLFLPWARAYFYNFEQALQVVSPQLEQPISLPYWDYTSKRAIKEGIPKLLAEPYYQKIDAEGNITDKKAINPLYQAEYIIPFKTYREEQPTTSLLKKAKKFAKVASAQKDFLHFGTSIYLADIMSHSYIGGSSANTASTSYDPIFWFTHCQLDHFWWQWQQAHPDGNDSVPSSVQKASLAPFQLNGAAMKGKEVLNTKDLGYTYL